MTPSKQVRGFTLLEILVVLVIISVLIGMASLSVNGASDTKRLEQAAQRVLLAADLAAQQAVLAARPIGMVFRENGFELNEYRQRWTPLETSARFAVNEFAPGIVLAANSLSDNAGENSPALIFLPDGENFLPEIELYDSNSTYSVILVPSTTGYRMTTPERRN